MRKSGGRTEAGRSAAARGGGGATTARVAAAVSIDAPRERVWEVLTDFEVMPRWFLGVRAVRVDGPPKVGARRAVTFRGGFTHLETIRAWTPPHHLALASAGRSRLVAEGDVSIRLEEDVHGVRLDWSIAYRLNLGRLAAALSRPLVQAVVGAALRGSLARLRRVAETAPRT